MNADGDLPAGDFSSWMIEMQGAIRGEHGSDVPCDGCTACCTSSQFIHIGPDETDTLAHIPAELLFPAPGLPPGHVVLGYDERGHCPMLIDERMLDLRASPADVSHVRLPDLPRRRARASTTPTRPRSPDGCSAGGSATPPRPTVSSTTLSEQPQRCSKSRQTGDLTAPLP